jgi:hypothetical protein
MGELTQRRGETKRASITRRTEHILSLLALHRLAPACVSAVAVAVRLRSALCPMELGGETV